MLVFRQLFDPTSSTYTYLLGCSTSGEAVLIDPVFEQVRRDDRPDQRIGSQAPVDARNPCPRRPCDRRVAAEAEARQRHRVGRGVRRGGRRPAARRRRSHCLRPAFAGSACDARTHQRLRHLRARRREHGLHRRLHPDPRLGPHRLPAGRPARALSLGALAHLLAARDLPALSGARLSRPHRDQRRRREEVQSDGSAARSARATMSAT